MSDLHWLTVEEVIQINAWAVEQTGEPHGTLFPDMLSSALAKPINHHAYEAVSDVLWLAVMLLFAIARNHRFQQGNKRTAFHAARAFLRRNGYDLAAEDEGLADIIIGVIGGDIPERDFSNTVAPFVTDWPFPIP